eukprot:g4146.t1
MYTDLSSTLRRCGTAQSEAVGTALAKTDASSETVPVQHYIGKKALVVGAGPAGSLAASFLSKQGFTVEVYEKRKDPLESDFVPSRSITMVLNNSTANVLRAAGLNIVNKDDQQSSYIRPFLGGALLNSSGGLTPPSKGSNASFLTQRHDLARSIISTVKRKTLNKVKFKFGHSCIGVDLKTKEVSFQYKDDNIVKRDYDLLVGADGSSSEIQKAMEQQICNFTVSALSNLLFYKSIQNITINENTVPEKYKQMIQHGVVTFYRDVKKFTNEEGLKAMSFTRSSNGNLVGSISAYQTDFENIKGKEKDCLNSAMPEDFPQDWIDQMIPQLRDNPVYRIPSVVEVSTLIGPNVVLIGDAGHSVSPGMAMGCNMAIQDTQVLNDALASAKGDINQALKDYNDIRHEEVSHIQLLEKIISAECYEQEGIKKLLPLAFKCFRRCGMAQSEAGGSAILAKTDSSSETVPAQHYVGKKALVVGAGPAGSVTASFLAKQGFQVFEKLQDPTKTNSASTRAIPVVLNKSAIDVLTAASIDVDIEAALSPIRQFFGFIFFTSNGEFTPYQNGMEKRFLTERNDLATHMMSTVRNKIPEKIKFNFDHSCIGVDLIKKKASFQLQDDSTLTMHYDLLVGADGANSEIRKAMKQQMDNVKTSAMVNRRFYKSFSGVEVNEDTIPVNLKKMLKPGLLSGFIKITKLEDKEGIRSVLLTTDNNGRAFGVFGGFESSFENIKGKEQEYLNDLLPEEFPRDLIDQMVVQLKDNPVRRMPSVVEVSTFIGPDVVLVGDAAHGLSAEMGIACDLAIKDGQALNDALELAEGDINRALSTYNDRRYEEASRIQLLEKVLSSGSYKQEGIKKLLPFAVKMNLIFHNLGNRYFPWLIPVSPFLRCTLEDITSTEAIRLLQLELAVVLDFLQHFRRIGEMENKARTKFACGLAARPRLHDCKPQQKSRNRRSQTVAQTKAAASNKVATTETQSEVIPKPYYVGKKALVVGSGPAGSLAASFLAKQGFDVEIFEKSQDPTNDNFVPSRSINMMLNATTTNVLEKAGIDVSISEGHSNPFHRFLYPLSLKPDGGFIPPSPKSGPISSLFVDRNDLANHIISTVRDKTSESVKFNFEQFCIGVDLTKREASFQHQENEFVKKSYDLLVGADGVNSQIRKAMEEQIDGLKTSANICLSYYKSLLNIVVKEDTVSDMYKVMLQPGLTTFYSRFKKLENMEGISSVVFNRSNNGNLAVNIIGSKIGFESIEGNEKEYLNAIMPESFPQDWIDQMIPQLKDNRLYKRPSVLEVSTLIGPNAVLIGDAGHSVSPGLGLGCNMAIQDTEALYHALESAKGDINRALENYNDIRYDEVTRIQQLEKMFSAGVYKQEGIKKLLPFVIRLHFFFHLIGHGYLPWLISRSAFVKCSLEEISSQEAITVLQIEFALLLGPAGSVIASFLAKQGFQVYEERKDPLQTNLKLNRVITMVLNNTTINVLKAADIEVLGSNDGPSNSIRRFICPLTLKPDGGFVPVESDFKLSVLVERNDLARHIISNVRNKIPESINFNFEMSCIGIDLAKREVSFQHQDTKIVTRNYDLLVGADGSSSEIRRAMEQQIDSLRSSSMLNLDYHKSFVDIVVKEDTVPNNYKKMLELGVITFYRRLKKFGNSMPIKRMSFTIGSKGRLFGNFIGTVSGFDSIKGKEKEYLNTVLPKDFPQDWIDQMIPQLRDNTLYRMPSVIELSTFIGPNVVLIGDAGHGVSPRLGMG